MQNQTTELVRVIEQSGLQESQVQQTLERFSGYFQEAKQIVSETKEIKVAGLDDIESMAQAKIGRKKLKEIRCEVENTRKELKERSLREGKAIDGIANVIKALIVPVEEYLESQEKFAEREMERRKTEVENERKEKLSKFVSCVEIYNLREMTNEGFERLLSDAELAHKVQLEAEAKAEKERLEQLAQQDTFRTRQLELAPYSRFITDKKLTLETTTKEYSEILSEAKEASKRYEAEQQKIKAENEALKRQAEEQAKRQAEALEAEKAKREQLENELRAKKELEEKQAREAEQAKIKALQAPDKEKLKSFADVLAGVVKTIPSVSSEKANKIKFDTVRSLDNLVNNLYNEITKL